MQADATVYVRLLCQTYRGCISFIHDSLGFYVEIWIIFGTVCTYCEEEGGGSWGELNSLNYLGDMSPNYWDSVHAATFQKSIQFTLYFFNKRIFIEYQRSKDNWFTSKKVESKNVKRTKARRWEAGVHCTVLLLYLIQTWICPKK